jgi:membrane-bound lytic murein transglycosylase D
MRTDLLLSLLLLVSCASKTPSTSSASRPPQQPSSDKTSSDKQVSHAAPLEPYYESSGDQLPPEPKEPAPEAEKVIGQEVEEQIAKEVTQEVPTFDIPIVMNTLVEKWLDYFQNRGRKYYAAYLERSGRYVPMMKRILRENGLPEDIIYLAMIESGFRPSAKSRAKAVGTWQFMKGTGKLYGLRTSFWIDERRDPEKSTIAAAQHLKDLYDEFNSWPLAFAGYNAGRGKITKAIRKYSTEDFWEMSRSRNRYLRSETKNYVPKMIAAALIAKSPEKYGFTNVAYENPLEYDKVLVPRPTEVSRIAEGLGIDEEILVDLNPELLKGITPPDIPNYELRIPKGFQEKFVAIYPDVQKKSITSVVRHVVTRQDTLASISKRYGVTESTLRSFNRMDSSRVRRGQQLAIPVYGAAAKEAETVVLAKFSQHEEELFERGKRSTYRVRSGDTLWSISRKFNISVSEIRGWNNLGSGRNIFPGQKLKLYARAEGSTIGNTPGAPVAAPAPAGETKEGWKTYTVQQGDSLWSISKQFGVTTSDLSNWNQLPSSDLRPGQELKIRAIGL